MLSHSIVSRRRALHKLAEVAKFSARRPSSRTPESEPISQPFARRCVKTRRNRSHVRYTARAAICWESAVAGAEMYGSLATAVEVSARPKTV